jgi:hypothetical protein
MYIIHFGAVYPDIGRDLTGQEHIRGVLVVISVEAFGGKACSVLVVIVSIVKVSTDLTAG